MWQLLYDSINSIAVIDLLYIPQVKALGFIEQIKEENQELKKILINLIEPQSKIEESEIQRGYALVEEEKLLGILFGSHVLHLRMQPFYKELIQRVVTISSPDDTYNSAVERIISRIIKEKNSIISPKEFDVISRFLTSFGNMQLMEDTFCIDTNGFPDLRLHQLCSTRFFRKIKNEYSRKWNTIVALKNFRVTKLYYKKHLLAGFKLYRKEDGEQFFWSGQFQEVLESLILKK